MLHLQPQFFIMILMVFKVSSLFLKIKKYLYDYNGLFLDKNMNKSIEDIDFEKSGGIVPVIVQDANTKDVLTLAYSNKESLELAKKTGKSWFWSRSRNKLWMKGEESGNTQKIKEILVDCDSDAIIYLVEPLGPACHTGERVCFHNELK